MTKSPGPAHRLIDARGNIDPRWLRWLEQNVGNSDSSELAGAIAALAERVDSLGGLSIVGRGSIQASGTSTVYVTLRGDSDSPGPSFIYGTDSTGAKGWQRAFDVINGDPDDFIVTDSGYVVLGEVASPADLPGTGNDGEAWRVIEESPGLYAWDGSAFTLDPSATGIVGLALAPVPDSGTGTLQKTAFDSKGRKTGTASATTTDLPEGTNLYHTTDRAQDAVGAAIAAGTGDGVTLAYDDSGNKINAANTDKGSVAVASHVAAADPHPQYVTSTEAEAYADAASASAAAAEAARDAAQLSAGVYADTAAGLAATTSGQYFSVPSADSAEYLILYKNNAGTAVEVKRYPSTAAITPPAVTVLPGAPVSWQRITLDGVGRVYFDPSRDAWMRESDGSIYWQAPLMRALGSLSTVRYAAGLTRLAFGRSNKCFRAYRDSDGAELDIGFNHDAVDEPALLAFAGSGTVRVRTLYAQAGSEPDLTFSTASRLPVIVSSGVAVRNSNGGVAMQFDISAGSKLQTAAFASSVAGPYHLMSYQEYLGTANPAYFIASTSPTVQIGRSGTQLHFIGDGGYFRSTLSMAGMCAIRAKPDGDDTRVFVQKRQLTPSNTTFDNPGDATLTRLLVGNTTTGATPDMKFSAVVLLKGAADAGAQLADLYVGAALRFFDASYQDAGPGIWNQWVEPRAGYDRKSGKTYIGMVGNGYFYGRGEVTVGVCDGAEVRPTNAGEPLILRNKDDHNNPAVLLPSAASGSFVGELSSAHSGGATIYRRFAAGDDVEAGWGPSITSDPGFQVEYAQTWRAGDGYYSDDASTIYFMSHGVTSGHSGWTIFKSTDEGATFDVGNLSIPGGEKDYSMVKRGSGARNRTLVIASHKHPTMTGAGNQNIWIALADATTGDVRLPGSSTVIANIYSGAYNPYTQGLVVYSAPGAGATMERTRLFDAAMRPDGSIDVVFARFHDDDNNSVIESGEYCVVHIASDGTVGAEEVIAGTGAALDTANSLYVAGIAVPEVLADGVEREVTLAREDAGEWLIERYQRVGGEWFKERTLARGGTVKRFRPCYPLNHSLNSVQPQVLWIEGVEGRADGGYTYITDYETRVKWSRLD